MPRFQFSFTSMAIIGLVCVLCIINPSWSTPTLTTYGFQALTSNNNASVAIAEAQMALNVYDWGSQIGFAFVNSGPDQATIEQIFLDDLDSATLDSVNGIEYSHSDILFHQDVKTTGKNKSTTNKPGNLPAGPKDFITDLSWSADSPAPGNGVNSGQSITLRFNLASGVTYKDVIASLGTQGGIQFGIHVINFDLGKNLDPSESLILKCPITPNPPIVPAPGALLLGSLGCGLLTWVKRRK